MIKVFTAEYSEGEYALIRTEQDVASLKLDIAVLRASVTRILEIGGNALHSCFVAGGEPKWTDSSQREGLIELSDALGALHRQITHEVAA